MRTEQELRQLATDIAEGKVFGTWCMSNLDFIPNVFMVINFLDDTSLEQIAKEKPVHIYEYLDKAQPMGVNGMPTFFSMNFISGQEWVLLLSMIDKLKKQKKLFIEEG
jgi:hypothetical protein